jgi:hypothetical protein
MFASGDPSSSSQFEHEECREAIGQAINTLTKAQYFGETLAGGETIPEGCVLATYDDVAVTTWNGVSKSTLPAIPIKLPRNMGVFGITKVDSPFSCFIPIPMGQSGFIGSQRGMSDLLGQVGYEVRGKEIIYNVDLPAASPAVTAVDMQLVVMDINKYNDFETLPINADMEGLVIEMVYNQLAKNTRKVSIDDTTKDNA